MLPEANLNRYRIFCVVAECESISRAAEKLYISQPAISKSITKLEENLKTSLFERTHKGVALTYEGKILYEQIKSAFNLIASGEEKINRINELGMGQLRLGTSAVLCKHMLIPYLKEYLLENPYVKVTIECQSSYHIRELIQDDSIDIGLIVRPENMTGLVFHSLGEIEDVFVSSPSYLNNFNPSENRNMFDSANIMLLDGSNVTRQHIDKYFYENNIEPHHILEISGMDILIEFAKIGLGVACVIKQFVQDEINNGTLVEIPLDIPINKREVGFAYIDKAKLTSPIQKFIQFFPKNSSGLL